MTIPAHVRRLPAGLVDAGLASIATFMIGLYAIRAFDDVTLGFYALFMAAFGLSTAISTNVSYVPAEKALLPLEADRRTLVVMSSATAGIGSAAVGGLVMAIPALIAFLEGAAREVVVGLAITAAATAVISPIQDHVRRLLHLGRRSWTAAATSAIQALGVGLAIVLLTLLDVDAPWVAFGALGIANVVSTIFGVWAAARLLGQRPLDNGERSSVAQSLQMRNLATSGRWLAGTGIVSTGNNLLVSSIILALAGEVALGRAEAARTIAQPILVVAIGLRGVLGPDLMEASKIRDRVAAAVVSRSFWMVLGMATVGYGLLVGVPWEWSPITAFAADAYVVPGLVILTIVANTCNGGALPSRLELIGADRESFLLRSELWSNSAQLVVGSGLAAVGGVWLGPASRPLSMVALGLVRLGLYRRPLAMHYQGARVPEPVA